MPKMPRFSMLSTALFIRFFSYVSAQIMSIVIPMAIYKLTHNIKLAGLSIILEWVPKIGIYLYSGELVKKWGLGNLLGAFMLFRLISLGFVVMALHLMLPWWAVTLAAVAYQANSAFFNLAYEINMAKWTSCSPSGHTKTLAFDNWAGIIGVGLGLFVVNLDALTGIAMLFLAVAVFAHLKYKNWLFGDKAETTVKGAYFDISAPFKALKKTTAPLWQLSFISILMGITPAIVFPVMPFFIEHAFEGQVVSTQFFSMANLARIGLSAVVLHTSVYIIQKTSGKTVFSGAAISSTVLTCLMLLVQGYAFLGLILLMGAINFCMYPWIRSTRQAFMPDNVCATSLTGVLSAVSSLAYIIGGFAVTTGLTAQALLLFCASSMLLTWALFKHFDFKHGNRAELVI